jgi:putative peptidoglycan lipid II flippase
MVAGTAVTLVSLPIYYTLYHWYGAMGLGFASNLGIALQTVTIALLLHQRRMVSLASLDYTELGRCMLAAVASGAGAWAALWGMRKALAQLPGHLGHTHLAAQIRWTDLGLLVVGAAIWLVIAMGVLEWTGSALPRVAMKRLGIN